MFPSADRPKVHNSFPHSHMLWLKSVSESRKALFLLLPLKAANNIRPPTRYINPRWPTCLHHGCLLQNRKGQFYWQNGGTLKTWRDIHTRHYMWHHMVTWGVAWDISWNMSKTCTEIQIWDSKSGHDNETLVRHDNETLARYHRMLVGDKEIWQKSKSVRQHLDLTDIKQAEFNLNWRTLTAK